MRNKFYLALLAAGALIALAVAGDASAFVMDGGSGSCLPPSSWTPGATSTAADR